MLNRNEDNVFHTIEFDTILDRVSDNAISLLGKERIGKLIFITEKDDLRREIARLTEMRDLLRYDDTFPLQEISELRPQMKRAEVVGAFLEPREFLILKSFLEMIESVKKYVSEREKKYLLLNKIVKRIILLPELQQEIERIINNSGEVKENASEKLFCLHREIERISSSIRKRLEYILRSMISKGYAQEESLVLRDGRLVVPLKEIHRGRLKGLVIDQSASGATLFVEPFEVLEMNNELRSIRIQERQEVERILKKLTDNVREYLFEIELNYNIAGDLDSLAARAKFSIQIDGNPARINEGGILELKKARHPLLLMRSSEDEVVPLSLRMGGKLKTLVITGPNAGGKTVALKTVGLLAMMHQHGLHVPADEGTTFPLFSNIFADIGDRQSIEQDLSTFSSHIENIKIILDKADQKSLVLLDEIGSATDPAEGSALATTILRNLTRRGCLSISTTHHGTLKVFAHEEPGVENGSMAFNRKTLRPIYQFQMKIPGSSYAFEIAERLGISKNIIEEAKSFLGEERGKLDRLILHLEDELQHTHNLLEEADIKESKLSGLVRLYKEQIENIQKKGEKKKLQILEEAENVLKEANIIVERVVQEIRESQADRKSILKAKRTIETERKKVELLSRQKEEEVEEYSFTKGDWVIWRGHGVEGEIVSEEDETGRVLIQQNGAKLKVPIKELEPMDKKIKRVSTTSVNNYLINRNITDEIHLRGMTAEEAIEVLEKYLGDAAIAGFTYIRIIHGKGTGILRREVSRYLKGHPLVKSQRLGNWNEGDTGVTIVELK